MKFAIDTRMNDRMKFSPVILFINADRVQIPALLWRNVVTSFLVPIRLECLQQIDISKYPLSPKALAELLKEVRAGGLDTSRGREVLAEMVSSGRSLAEAVKKLGIEQVDETALVDLCRELLAANPKIVAEVKEGKQKGIGQLIGQAKKKNPNANPNRVREICLELIEKGI